MKRTYFLIGLLLVVAVLLATLISYPYLPDRVPTHWDAQGHVNGYSARWTLFVTVPGIMLAILGMFRLLPWLSPKHFEVDTFVSTYLYIMLVLLAFSVYLHGLILWVSVGGHWNMGQTIGGGVCLLFALLGNVMGKVRRNFWIGVRTPWTIANERVWNATHRFAAKTFVLGGLAGLVLTLAGAGAWPMFVALMAGALTPVVHSLVYYKHLERRGEV
jgi:uncharacterized membrane protein